MTPEQLERKRKAGREYMARQRAANPEKIKEARRKWYQLNPEKYRAYVKEWREANKDAVLERRREIYATDGETHRQRSREWFKQNSEKAAARYAIYSAENREKIRAGQAAWRKTDAYIMALAKRRVAKVMGVSARDVPQELADVKFMQLKVKRLIHALG